MQGSSFMLALSRANLYLSMLHDWFCSHFLLFWSISYEMWNVIVCKMHTTSACKSAYLPLLEHRLEPHALPSPARSATPKASAKHPTPSPALREKVATMLMAPELHPLPWRRNSQVRVPMHTRTPQIARTMCMRAQQRTITKLNGACHRPPS